MPSQPIVLKEKSAREVRWHTLLCLIRSSEVVDFRRALEIMRTGYWFEWLCERTGKFTPYSVGKAVLPEGYGKNANGVAFSDALWPKYPAGTHVPRERLHLVEDKVPGSRAAFSHRLFDAMDVTSPLGNRGSELLRALHPAVQRAVFANKQLAIGLYERRPVTQQMLRLLERIGDLDALTGAIVLFREACERDQRKSGFGIADSIFRLLLAATIAGPAYRLRSEIALIVVFRILRFARWEGRAYVPDLDDFWSASNLLLLAIDATGDEPSTRTCGKRTYDFLRGRHGAHLWLGLQPIIALDVTQTEWPIDSQVDVYTRAKIGQWAWNVLLFGRKERVIPDELADEIKRDVVAIRTRNDPRTYPPELAGAQERAPLHWGTRARNRVPPAISDQGMGCHPLLGGADASSTKGPRPLICAL